ncbi:MAG: ankyrin repeat domain-containing protein [Alphaproteobacteria bacterium]|nr:ankyrin repeat domain-containing protein [Alphaproteobacteria bacterium]
MNNFIACLLIAASFLFTDSAKADNVILSDAEDLEFKTDNGEELVYDKNGELYSGAVVLPDEENHKMTYFYQNGKKHGIAFSRLASGKMEFETTYANGKKNGEEILFYPNGNPQYKRTYKNNIIDGEELLFHQNGKPQKQSRYTDGKLNGEVHYFNENGDHIRIETYKDGIKNGMERIIENNILREENQYVNGILEGTTKKYDTQYLTDEIQYVNGKRNGIHKTYGDNGSLREIPYKNDKKEGEGKIYNPNKTIAESIVYANDKRNGMYQKFAPDGKLILAENYKDDMKDGISRYFNDKGELTEVSYYINGVELSKVETDKRVDIKSIQDAFTDKQLDKYSNKRNLWYKILWLGLNINQPEILETLEKEMKMYAVDIDDMRIYERYSGGQFDGETKQLFFGMSPLGYAVNIEAPTEVLQKFISQKEEPNSRGFTPLRDAVRLNKTDMVKFLLLNGADLKEKDNDGNDILLYAIINESPYNMIDNIIKSGGNVNTHNNQEQTPITVALAQKNIDLVKLLIVSGAETKKLQDGENLLYYAYNKKAPLEIIKALIENGFNINSTDTEGNNLLLKALKNNDEKTALFALENNADINQKDNEGETAVSYVLYNKVSPEINDIVFKQDYDVEHKLEKPDKMLWKILMEQNKLDLLKKTWDKMSDIRTTADAAGEIPLDVALKVTDNPQLHELALSYIDKADDKMIWNVLKDKNFELFKDLLSKQANINSKNSDGDSLLIYMVKNGYDQKFSDLLLSEKLNIDAEDGKMKTALDIAIEKNDLKLAEYLLKEGANPDRLINGETYITKATPAQDELVKLLFKYAKQIKTDLPNNESISLRAVKRLNLPLFEYLVANNAFDSEAADDNGNSLLLSAADYFAQADDKVNDKKLNDNFLAIVKILLEKGADINMRNGNGETLLIKLAQNCGTNYEELAKFLIEKGADTGLKDQYNKTAEDYRQQQE